jgi:membrane protein DedA with SNARE-associated domain
LRPGADRERTLPSVLDSIAHFVQGLIRDIGYPGLFLLIVLESTLVPIPSLLVMPFAGFLAARGEFSLPVILIINSTAALTGSAISYVIGAAGGKPLLLRYGKYILVRPSDLAKTEQWFARNGAWTVLIARFLPIVRHIISVPAGIARMKLSTFFAQTFLGATIWGGGLMVLGYELGARWESVMKTAKKFDLAIAAIIIVAIVVAIVMFVVRRRRAKVADAVGAASTLDRDASP